MSATSQHGFAVFVGLSSVVPANKAFGVCVGGVNHFCSESSKAKKFHFKVISRVLLTSRLDGN